MEALKYQTDFKIIYKVEVGTSWLASVTLAMGYNYLETLKEKINLAIIYTRYNGKCYAINTSRKVDEGRTKIFIKFTYSGYNRKPRKIPVIFTSKMNS